jgi:hypothetical protein
MPDWGPIDPQLRQWVAEGVHETEMCRRLAWDKRKRQTIVDRLRKLGLKAPAQAKPKTTEEIPMSDETVAVLPEPMAIEDADTPPDAPVSAIADLPAVSGELVEPLSVADVQTLEHYERIIAHGFKTFVDVGLALVAIREQRLYRQDYGTFEDYLRQRWDLGQSRAYQLMDAANVVTVLKSSTTVELPMNEAQTRPLTRLPAEQQAEVWQEAVETAPAGKVTADHVKKTVNRRKGTPADGPKVKTPKMPEPEPRPPARKQVQDELTYTLRSISDEQAWPVLAALWLGIESYWRSRPMITEENLTASLNKLKALLPLFPPAIVEGYRLETPLFGEEKSVQDGLFAVLSMVDDQDAWPILGELARQLDTYAERQTDPDLMQRMEQALSPLWHLIDAHQATSHTPAG